MGARTSASSPKSGTTRLATWRLISSPRKAFHRSQTGSAFNGPEGRESGTGQLASRIAASGYASSDVTIVAISHLHADHISSWTAIVRCSARHAMSSAKRNGTTGPRPMSP
ncbi:MBL fold metallo-hydrolase [Sinorhizobium medicae]|nr:MBL fold metallo-hydrolase [Sinorhizobium medicae]MDX1145659.1 MBL fold metallo-hydrolase [Sinorhizobium medicae]